MGPEGHRVRPHTADLAVEAWAPTRAGCLREAVRGLVASFADTRGVRATSTKDVVLPPGRDDDVLVDLLEEVVYLMDADGVLPVDVTVTEEHGGLAVRFSLAPMATVEITGAGPKAVALHDLAFGHGPEGWRCHVLVDV